MASAAIAPFRSLLEERLTTKTDRRRPESFIQITSTVLLHRKKFVSDIQLCAYLWAHAMTSSRLCVGQNGSDWSDITSLPDWASMLDCSERQAFNVLKCAIDRGVLLRKEVKGKGFKYRPCSPDDLATVPLPVPPQREAPPPPAPDDDDDQEEQEQDQAGAVQIRPVSIAHRKKTRKIDLAAAVSKIQYDNCSGIPLILSGQALRGVLLLRVQAQANSEETAMSPCNRLQGSTSDPRAARQDLRDALNVEFYVPQTGDVVEDTIWPKVAAAAGPDLPVEAVLKLFRSKIAIFRSEQKPITPALSISWMQFARSRWENAQRSRPTAPPTPEPSNFSREERIQLIAYALETLAEYPDDDAARGMLEGSTPAELAAARKIARAKVPV